MGLDSSWSSFGLVVAVSGFGAGRCCVMEHLWRVGKVLMLLVLIWSGRAVGGPICCWWGCRWYHCFRGCWSCGRVLIGVGGGQDWLWNVL